MSVTPADSAPPAWMVTAWPDHADWGESLDEARGEIADLAAALAGRTPDTASARPPQTETKRHEPLVAAPRGPSPGPPERDMPAQTTGGLLVPGSPLGLVMAPFADDIAAVTAVPATAPDTRRTQCVMLSPSRGAAPPGNRYKDESDEVTPPTVLKAAVPYGDIWLRDTGPIIVRAGTEWRAAAFRFNGWGGRYVYDGDHGVAEYIAALGDLGVVRVPMVGEPGALVFDGEGTAIASRRCLLNRNRNPDLSESDAAHVLRQSLGVERVIWLDETLAGDHTDGHADTLARFVRPGLVVTEAPRGARDRNGEAKDGVARRLDGVRDAQGRPIDVARIPSPGEIKEKSGAPLPATHLNFVTAATHAAHRLIVPTYDAGGDAALSALSAIFPDHEILGLSAQAVITGGGAFHCCTCSAPAGAPGPHTP